MPIIVYCFPIYQKKDKTVFHLANNILNLAFIVHICKLNYVFIYMRVYTYIYTQSFSFERLYIYTCVVIHM